MMKKIAIVIGAIMLVFPGTIILQRLAGGDAWSAQAAGPEPFYCCLSFGGTKPYCTPKKCSNINKGTFKDAAACHQNCTSTSSSSVSSKAKTSSSVPVAPKPTAPCKNVNDLDDPLRDLEDLLTRRVEVIPPFNLKKEIEWMFLDDMMKGTAPEDARDPKTGRVLQNVQDAGKFNEFFFRNVFQR